MAGHISVKRKGMEVKYVREGFNRPELCRTWETDGKILVTLTQDQLKDIYEKAGVEEFWIVSPQGSVEIYYLQDGKYVLEQNYLLQDGKEDEEYNAELEICLKAFPHIKMSLGEIFEGVY